MTYLRAIRIALPLAAILGLCLALWLTKRDARHWQAAYTAAVAAGAAATEAQKASNWQQEARWATKARETDAEYRNALGLAHSASVAYIRGHHTNLDVRVCAGTGAQRRSDPVPEASGAEPTDRAGENAELVGVTADDVSICTENSVRLQAAVEWAKGLNQRN